MENSIKELQKEMRQGFQEVRDTIEISDKSTHEIFAKIGKDVRDIKQEVGEIKGKVDTIGSRSSAIPIKK